jgi:hypothetical protein
MHSQRLGGWRGWCLAIAALPAAAYGASAPLIHHTFEDGVSGWTGIGVNSKAALTRDAAHVKEGKAALQFDYTVEKGEMGALRLTPDPAFAKAKSLRFWVHADAPTTLAVVLHEKQGGRYSAAIAAPADAWQQVEIAPSDFTLRTDKDDPKDPNSRLDLDQIEAIEIFDLAQIFAQIEEPTLRDLLGAKPGAHTLFVDDFTVSEDALPEAPAVEGELRLDRFERPQLQWIAVGDVLISRAKGEGQAEGSLKADYTQGPGKIVGVVRPLPHGKLVGMERLRLDVASARPTELVIVLEESSGGKYNTRISIPGELKVQKLSLKLSEFDPSSDSKDNNTQLDLDQVTQVIVLDLSGFTGVDEGDNTLRLSNLRAVPAKTGP